MKTIFDSANLGELIGRIDALHADSPAQWGKMNAGQMVEHCILWQEMILGHKKFKRVFLGYIFGKVAMKDMLKDKPVKKNLPTIKGFDNLKANNPIDQRKQRWIALLQEHAGTAATGFDHPFFGRMTREQTGLMAYKHIDHHLQQFGC